jgi:hypothetical protein
MMRNPVEDRGCHFGVPEDRYPFTELQVRGDDGAGFLIELADEVEQQRPAGLWKREPIGPAGLSTIRSVIGGLFLASVTMLVIGLTLGFIAVAILLSVVAFGRIVGIVSDGFDKAVVPPLVVELVIIAVLVAAPAQLAT